MVTTYKRSFCYCARCIGKEGIRLGFLNQVVPAEVYQLQRTASHNASQQFSLPETPTQGSMTN